MTLFLDSEIKLNVVLQNINAKNSWNDLTATSNTL